MPYKKDDPRAKEARLRWYYKNRDKAIGRTIAYRKELRRFVLSLKKKCERCGETHSACLEFHHLDPSVKEHGFSRIHQLNSKPKIEEELAKCIVLCANCHRKEHHKNHNI